MKEYVIKLGAEVVHDGDGGNTKINPVATWGGLTQIISAYGSNISIVQVDYEVKKLTIGNDGMPYPAVYANFGELEDSIPLKNGVAYKPETKFEKVQFNLKIDTADIADFEGLNKWEVKATIRILIGDGKYEQFATDAALNALEAIAQLQLKTAGGEYLGAIFQNSRKSVADHFYQRDIEPNEIPDGANYAIMKFHELEQETSAGFLFTPDVNGVLGTAILNVQISQDNGASLLFRADLIKIKRLLNSTGDEVLIQELEYKDVVADFPVDSSQHIAVLQDAHLKYKWNDPDSAIKSRYGFAGWRIEFYKR